MAHLYEEMGLPSNIIYIREINIKDLPIELREQLKTAKDVFAVFAEDGQQIALVDNQNIAFEMARQHDFSLHLVH